MIENTNGYTVGLLRRCLHDVFGVLRFLPVLQICEIAYEGFILEKPRLGQVYKRSYSQKAMQETMAHRISHRYQRKGQDRLHATRAVARCDTHCKEPGAHAAGIEGWLAR